MAYEKQTWACGDTITAEKLNHMENGIKGGDIHQLTVEKEDGYYVISGEQVKAIANDRPAIVQASMGWYEDTGGATIMAAYNANIALSGELLGELLGVSLQFLILKEKSQGVMETFHSSYEIVDEQIVMMMDGFADGSDTVQYMFMYDAESNTYKCAIEG